MSFTPFSGCARMLVLVFIADAFECNLLCAVTCGEQAKGKSLFDPPIHVWVYSRTTRLKARFFNFCTQTDLTGTGKDRSRQCTAKFSKCKECDALGCDGIFFFQNVIQQHNSISQLSCRKECENKKRR